MKKHKSILEVTPDEVVKVYSGKPGCGCGCRGNYRVNPAHLDRLKDRGYPLSVEEINLSSVKRILREMQARAGEVESIEGDTGEVIYSLEDETRYRWAYVAV